MFRGLPSKKKRLEYVSLNSGVTPRYGIRRADLFYLQLLYVRVLPRVPWEACLRKQEMILQEVFLNVIFALAQ
jgi:hypothetical protein